MPYATRIPHHIATVDADDLDMPCRFQRREIHVANHGAAPNIKEGRRGQCNTVDDGASRYAHGMAQHIDHKCLSHD